MTRELYHQKMARLERETLDLGHVIAAELPAAVDAVLRRDVAELERIVTRDRDVNRERIDIEGEILLLIATQQPMAVDMRLLASLLEMVGEVERIGDYVKGIAKIGLRMDAQPVPVGIAAMLVQMADRCSRMLQAALRSFAARDPVAARDVVAQDDEVDDLFEQVFQHVVRAGAPDPAQLERSNYQLWIAHNLERTADRVTNICERAIYVVTGALLPNARSVMEVRLDSLAHPAMPPEPGGDVGLGDARRPTDSGG